MEQIVTKGIRIDLHIHSVFSKDKDGKKVQNNTLENLNLLPSNVQSTDRGADAIIIVIIRSSETTNQSIHPQQFI